MYGHDEPDVIRITQSLSIYRRVRRYLYYSIYITSITITYALIITTICFMRIISTMKAITITIIKYFRKKFWVFCQAVFDRILWVIHGVENEAKYAS